MDSSNCEELLISMRVLDLTDDKGYFCGRMLGDLGADVIKIEPPGGDPGRRIGPFYHDIPDPEKSLNWFAGNASKRGITLNLETTDGRGLFKRLASKADVVVESFSPGYMDKLGVGYEALQQLNPAIILTSISPFGQRGPYSQLQGPDIVVMAMAGHMYISGDPDRPPVRVSVPQAYMFACADAASGTLIACNYRELTGEGQHVDVAAQDSVHWVAGPAVYWSMAQTIIKREGPFRGGATTMAKQRQVWRCKDGYVAFQVFGGMAGRKTQDNLVRWIDEEGMADEVLKSEEWRGLDMHKITQDQLDKIEAPIGKFLMSHTKEELREEGIKRDVMLYLVSDTGDILASPQLKAREFWVEQEHPELNDSIVYPGAWTLLSGPGLKIRCRAPLIGEHNEEVYLGELGLTKGELVAYKEAGIV